MSPEIAARASCAAASTLLLWALCRSGEWRWNYALVVAAALEAIRWATWAPEWAMPAETAWSALVALAGLEAASRAFRYAPRAWARVKSAALAAAILAACAALGALGLPEVERWGYRGLLAPLAAAFAVLCAIRGGCAYYGAPRERLADAVLARWPWALATQALQVAAWEISIPAGQWAGRLASAAYVWAALATTTATGALDPEPQAAAERP